MTILQILLYLPQFDSSWESEQSIMPSHSQASEMHLPSVGQSVNPVPQSEINKR